MLRCSKQQKKKGLRLLATTLMSCWCRGRESNPHGGCHYHLKIACLPIPPPRREKRYMQNRGGWQAFFCDSVKFFRLSAGVPAFFPLRALRMARVGRSRIPCYGRGGEICLFRLLRVLFWGPRNPALGGSRFDPHTRRGWQRRKDALFLQSVRKGLPCRALHVNAGGIG